ncbi:MAG: helix-turn-helix domain-containing protein [Gammaproteobacteria bacterium]|nr:MAG: helix-turn-helix domain-containing protein [Gammaproteobacteria bacterium]
MAAVDDNTAQQSRPSGIGPGERLQAARIQQGLSIEDVASRMHLSTSILEAIEDNNFEEITAPIFVKGYLRAYARIVSLDEDEMIQQYMEYYSEEDPPISSTGNVAPELSVTDARIRWTTYLVIIVLAVLLSAWWWNKGRDEEPTISLDAQAPTGQTEPTETEVARSEIEAASESVAESTESLVAGESSESPAAGESTESSVTSLQPTEPVDTVTAEPAVAESDTQDVAASSEPEVAVETEQPAAVEPEFSVIATVEPEPEPESAPVIPDSPILVAPSGSDKLQIIVNADTWADIKDSTGYQMVYDLLRADQSLELTGAAPFSVFLGNGHGVEILINDEVIDFSNRIRGDNTARLKIGG